MRGKSYFIAAGRVVSSWPWLEKLADVSSVRMSWGLLRNQHVILCMPSYHQDLCSISLEPLWTRCKQGSLLPISLFSQETRRGLGMSSRYGAWVAFREPCVRSLAPHGLGVTARMYSQHLGTGGRRIS